MSSKKAKTMMMYLALNPEVQTYQMIGGSIKAGKGSHFLSAA